ncbi:MAG: hypothetical protein AAF212_13255 [Verrucomicrobiota bacterium]
MNRTLKRLFFATCCAASLWVIRAEETVEKVKWLYSYQDAIAEAKKTDKPIFLEFRCAP